MRQLFAVIRSRGPAWQTGHTLEAQQDWAAHAAFMGHSRPVAVSQVMPWTLRLGSLR